MEAPIIPLARVPPEGAREVRPYKITPPHS
jgi:hypothetical protein